MQRTRPAIRTASSKSPSPARTILRATSPASLASTASRSPPAASRFSGDNRIEGNNCTGADRGIDIDSIGNIIIRNTCSGNTIDWVIAANNVFGPIIDRRAPASAAVSGFSAASTLGSTDANANFSY